MSVFGKLHGEVELESDAQTIYDVYARGPDQISNICPKIIHSCTLHHGEFGKTGAIVEWTYFHGTSESPLKQTPKMDSTKGGCVARWTFTFKTTNGSSAADLRPILDVLLRVLKDIDNHLHTTNN